MGPSPQQMSLSPRKPSPHDLPPCKFSLGDLPVELVLQIAALVSSPIDKLCLALTCQSLMVLLEGKSLQQSFRFRQPGEWPRHPGHWFRTERWKLLCQLEDSHWRCCSGCLKLHPTNEFTDADLLVEAKSRLCMFGSLASLVHLCPCISMTYRDKLRLIARLKEQAQSQDATKNNSATTTIRCWHECRHPYPPEGMVHIQHDAILENHENLIIQTRYLVVPMTIGCAWRIQYEGDCVAPLCPHRELTTHCEDLMRIVKDRESWKQGITLTGNPTSVACQWCHTSFTNVYICPCPPPRLRPVHTCSLNISFVTRRRLGHDAGADQPFDQKWFDQTDLAFVRACYTSRTLPDGRTSLDLKPGFGHFWPTALWI